VSWLEADVANGCRLVRAPRPPIETSIETSIEMAGPLVRNRGSCRGVVVVA